MSAEIARVCAIHRTAVYQWKQVPPTRVLTVANIMGLSPEVIRPDIFKPGKQRAW
jgi:hypothetical protein